MKVETARDCGAISSGIAPRSQLPPASSRPRAGRRRRINRAYGIGPSVCGAARPVPTMRRRSRLGTDDHGGTTTTRPRAAAIIGRPINARSYFQAGRPVGYLSWTAVYPKGGPDWRARHSQRRREPLSGGFDVFPAAAAFQQSLEPCEHAAGFDPASPIARCSMSASLTEGPSGPWSRPTHPRVVTTAGLLYRDACAHHNLVSIDASSTTWRRRRAAASICSTACPCPKHYLQAPSTETGTTRSATTIRPQPVAGILHGPSRPRRSWPGRSSAAANATNWCLDAARAWSAWATHSRATRQHQGAGRRRASSAGRTDVLLDRSVVDERAPRRASIGTTYSSTRAVGPLRLGFTTGSTIAASRRASSAYTGSVYVFNVNAATGRCSPAANQHRHHPDTPITGRAIGPWDRVPRRAGQDRGLAKSASDLLECALTGP